jgi:hypothetical protein
MMDHAKQTCVGRNAVVAIEHGPVPSATRDVLRPEFDWRAHFKEAGGITENSRLRAVRRINSFMRSGRKTKGFFPRPTFMLLAEAMAIVKSLKFSGVQDQTHKHKAYIDAWGRPGRIARPIRSNSCY